MDNEYFASINEVSKKLSVPAHTLRYWEKQFPVAIRPTTGAGGRRYYRAETVHKLETIRALLYDRGMTIAGVKKMLRDGEFPTDASEIKISKPKQTIEKTVTDIPVSVATQSASHIDVAEIEHAIDLLETARQLII